MPCANDRRKRHLVVAFRATPKENELVSLLAKAANMTKQEYIMAKLTDTQIVVHPSLCTFKALKDEMVKVYAELERIRRAGGMSDDLVQRVELLADIFRDLGAEVPKSKLDTETAAIAGMARGTDTRIVR